MSGNLDAPARPPDATEDPTAIAPEVLAAAGGESDPVAIARAIADDVPAGAATPSAVEEAAAVLENHALVAVTDNRLLTRTERGDAVAFVRSSPRRTATLYAHALRPAPVRKATADEWVRAVVGERAAWLPDVGDATVLGPYNPLGRYVDDDAGVLRVAPTDHGRGLARAIHVAWLDLVGGDRAWERVREVVGDGE